MRIQFIVFREYSYAFRERIGLKRETLKSFLDYIMRNENCSESAMANVTKTCWMWSIPYRDHTYRKYL